MDIDFNYTDTVETSTSCSSSHSSPLHHHLNLYNTNYTNRHRNSLLQVTTEGGSTNEIDPNERTARPSNAHVHAEFHSQTISSHVPMEMDEVVLTDTNLTRSTPGISNGLSRPLKPREQERLAHLDRLKFFLHTAPSMWDRSESGVPMAHSHAYPHASPMSHPALNRFLLPTQEYVSCVLWNGLYHITGTDIVRALVFRFEAFGRPVRNMKKFEEGVFSDLRNLKPGVDACLEEPKSGFLDLLFKYQCIRTQKKQKVFYWFSVPHDRLFLDALERDLKREKIGQEPTTQITGEPALSFTYDPKRSLYEQFSKAQGAREGEGELEVAVRRVTEGGEGEETEESEVSESDEIMSGSGEDEKRRLAPAVQEAIGVGAGTWFEGNPSYKQRKKKSTTTSVVHPGLGQMKREESERGRIRPDLSSHQKSKSVDINPQFQAPPPSMSSYIFADPPPSTHTKTKAFVCPLFSCGRMFKRMEHLKRHLRTHTMERPYMCVRCQKRFSRSDNLNQHMRTHIRGEVAQPKEVESDFEEGVDYHQHQQQHHQGDFDAQMCEVEVLGDVQDVSGDEEGLITRASVPYYSHPQQQSFNNVVYPSTNHFESWTPSPAFTTLSLSSSSSPPVNPGMLPIRRGSSVTSPLINPSSSSFHNRADDNSHAPYPMSAAMSAPSHRQTFDHAAMYLDGPTTSAAGGPVRRPRSMTPSIMRNGESVVRRPLTSGGAEYHPGPLVDSPRMMGLGLPAQSTTTTTTTTTTAGRGYHPYASYASASSSSRTGSTHSSPSLFSIPLDGGGAHRRSDSRNSSLGGVQEQTRQLMNISLEGPGMSADSPVPFRVGDLPATAAAGLYAQEWGQRGRGEYYAQQQ